MQLPKLQRVEESDLQRVELKQPSIDVVSPSTNLERAIATNELILQALSNVLLENKEKELEPFIVSKIQELNETMGEQKLSLQLLRLLEEVGGDKSKAALFLQEWIDFK